VRSLMPVRLGCVAMMTAASAAMARPRSRPMNCRTWERSFSLPAKMSAEVSSPMSFGRMSRAASVSLLRSGVGRIRPLMRSGRPSTASFPASARRCR
jgi:hypothetical protein